MPNQAVPRSHSRYERLGDKVTSRSIHWAAPATTIGALLAGVLFAIGHHLFYASLRGQQVGDGSLSVLGSSITRQQINITAGTIFAFVVNFCLGTALATAYAQVFWHTLLYRKATLETWDAAFSATSNIFFILKATVWWHLPLLFAFAVIAWAMPFATTFPPGTLSVGLRPVDPAPKLIQQVPNVDFISLNYVGLMPRSTAGSEQEDSQLDTQFLYQGPSTNVQRVADQVAQTGELLPISFNHTNASYILQFDGPGLACNTVPESLQKTVQTYLKTSLDCEGVGVYGYSAWKNGGSAPGLSGNVSSLFDKLDNAGLSFNIMAFPHMMDLVPNIGGGLSYIPYTKACESNAYDGLDNPDRFENSTMLQCSLRNVTYTVQFNYTNGDQSVGIDAVLLNNDPINRVTNVRGLGNQYPDNVHNGVDCTVISGVFDSDNPDPNNICLVNTRILKTLSYQSIFDAFNNLFTGSVTRSMAVSSPNVSTNVESTVLVDAPELTFLNPYSDEIYPSTQMKPLQAYVQVGDLPIFQGLVNNVRIPGLASLPQTLETLFQKVTVSMMSSQALRPNTTSQYLPNPVEVTLHNIHPVYEYAPARLWLAYGIAIACALIVTLFGLWAIVANNASYSTDFSTIFRIARGMSVSEEVKAEDTHGSDPLPEYLKKAKVWLDGSVAAAREKAIELEHLHPRDQGGGAARSPTVVARTAGTPSRNS